MDTTAAGDAFTGALGASLARGASLPEAVRRGLAAGALAVTVRGASPSLPTAAAIDSFLAERADLSASVVAWTITRADNSELAVGFGFLGDRLLPSRVRYGRWPIRSLNRAPQLRPPGVLRRFV